MPVDTHPRHRRTPEEITREQTEQAVRDKARAKAREATGENSPVGKPSGNGGATVPATVSANTAVAVPDTRTPIQQYLDLVAPASIVGRLVKFDSKRGTFVTHDDDEAIGDDIDFTVLADQTLVGWVRFHGEGEPPDKKMGLLFDDNFTMAPRSSLGDDDQTKWELGPDKNPADPWQNFMYLVLQNASTGELFTYTTSSITGRRAVGNLLRHFGRLQKTHPDQYPVVRLKAGSFQHRDKHVGQVNVPVLAVTGRAQKDSAAKPDTSVAGDMSNSIPF